MVDKEVQRAIKNVVEYLWQREWEDFIEVTKNGEIVAGEGRHIFEDVRLIDFWLRQEGESC